MYFFTVGAIFKNESHCIIEWIEHYLNQGAEHFYLINDDSTDDTVKKLEKYIKESKITLYHISNSSKHALGYQRNMYNKYILPHVKRKEMKWLLMCDLDEFVYSSVFKKVSYFLKDYVANLAQIQIIPTLFGSNNLEKQPESLIQNFIRRTKENPTNCGTYKYIINSEYEYISLNVHHADTENKEYMKGEYFMKIKSPFIRLNHYICQSKEFWINIKCKRGDADGYLERDMKLFEEYNGYMNEVEDFELATIQKEYIVYNNKELKD